MKISKLNLKQLIREEHTAILREDASLNNLLHNEFVNAIDRVDSSLGYETLAEVIARILIEDYGKQNFRPFLLHLASKLSESSN